MTTDQIIALASVIVGAAGPLAVVVVAFMADKRFKHFEQGLDKQRRASDTRFELYREIGFKLNDLYAYFMYVGNWKDHSPAQIIAHKRELDRHIFTYRPLFSDTFNSQFDRFILDCFEMFGGWRKDARLRTTSKYRAEHGDDGWAECFTQEDNRKAIKSSYASLLNILADDLGIKPNENAK